MKDIIFIFIIVVAVYSLHLFNTDVNEPIKKSMSQLLNVTFHSNTIRSLYGEHGRNYADDYKKYRTEQQTKSVTEVSRAPSPFYLQKIEESNFAGNPGASPAPSSPYGVHGNNYSIYDINSPTGQFGKL